MGRAACTGMHDVVAIWSSRTYDNMKDNYYQITKQFKHFVQIMKDSKKNFPRGRCKITNYCREPKQWDRKQSFQSFDDYKPDESNDIEHLYVWYVANILHFSKLLTLIDYPHILLMS